MGRHLILEQGQHRWYEGEFGLATASGPQILQMDRAPRTAVRRDALLRAGLPGGWVPADKTGTGECGTANDIGVAWTTRKTPVLLTVLSTKSTRDAPADDSLVAEAARIVVRALAPGQ